MDRDTLPVHGPGSFPEQYERSDSSVRGVLLAAGTSSRYGTENKLLATLDDEPLVRLAAEALVESDVDGTTVVVGHECDRVTDALAGLDVTVRENEAYAEGQSMSVRTGILDAANRDVDAALIALGDMPRVTPKTNNLLIEAYKRGVADVLAAAYRNQRGNPVLFDARFFDALTAVNGDVGGRKLLTDTEEAVAIETANAGVLHDVDHPSDLDTLR